MIALYITYIILFFSFIILLLSDKSINKIWKIFDKPLFKIPFGSFLILFSVTFVIKFIKILPPFGKIGIIIILFLIIYSVINFLFTNKTKKND